MTWGRASMDRLPKLSPGIVEEASDWLIEFSEDTLDDAGREQFDAWLRRSPEHVQAYLKITMLWEESSLLGKNRVLAADELVARVLAEGNIVPLTRPARQESDPPTNPAGITTSHASSAIPSSREVHLGHALPVRFAIAAAALLSISAGSWLFAQRETYSTAIGEQRSV